LAAFTAGWFQQPSDRLKVLPQADLRDVLDASNSSKTSAEKKFASPIEWKLWQ
jgi:hypothetical protein